MRSRKSISICLHCGDNGEVQFWIPNSLNDAAEIAMRIETECELLQECKSLQDSKFWIQNLNSRRLDFQRVTLHRGDRFTDTTASRSSPGKAKSKHDRFANYGRQLPSAILAHSTRTDHSASESGQIRPGTCEGLMCRAYCNGSNRSRWRSLHVELRRRSVIDGIFGLYTYTVYID